MLTTYVLGRGSSRIQKECEQGIAIYIPSPVDLSATLNLRDTALLSIVMPRSCSSSLLSRYLIFPAILVDMMLFAARSASIMVVFPWSTWPIVVTLRTSIASAVAIVKTRRWGETGSGRAKTTNA